MNITEIRIRKIDSDSKMKAVASVTLGGEIVIHDIKVIDGKNGLFIAMPSRQTPDGKYKDIVHPLNVEAREELQSAILDMYNKPAEEEE